MGRFCMGGLDWGSKDERSGYSRNCFLPYPISNGCSRHEEVFHMKQPCFLQFNILSEMAMFWMSWAAHGFYPCNQIAFSNLWILLAMFLDVVGLFHFCRNDRILRRESCQHAISKKSINAGLWKLRIFRVVHLEFLLYENLTSCEKREMGDILYTKNMQ